MIRVTEVLNYFAEPWKLEWYAKNGKAYCNRVSKAAMKIGTRVDEIIKSCPTHSEKWDVEWFTKKNPEEVRNCLTAYTKWEAVYKPKSITPCTRLFATIDGQEVSGEPDLLVDDVLVDIKCSTKISPAYWVQVTMYRYLDHIKHADIAVPPETFKFNGKVGILRLDKQTGSYEYVVQDYDYDKVFVWCGLLKAYCYFKGDSDGGIDV